MIMNNKTYDVLKWVITIVMPAAATLIQTVGKALSWGGTDLTVTILVAVTTFLGAIFMKSSADYKETHMTIEK